MQLDRPIYVYMCVCTGTPLLTLRFADEECCDAGEGHVGESGRLCDIPHEPLLTLMEAPRVCKLHNNAVYLLVASQEKKRVAIYRD